MENKDIDEVFAGLLTVFPLFRKRINKIGDEILLSKGISRTHVNLLEIVKKNGPTTMTDLGKLLNVSKPNITILVDKLVKLELVKRIYDEKDRRVIFIELTGNGHDFLEKLRESMKTAFGKSVEKFSQDDLKLFKETINNLKILVDKMEE